MPQFIVITYLNENLNEEEANKFAQEIKSSPKVKFVMVENLDEKFRTTKDED